MEEQQECTNKRLTNAGLRKEGEQPYGHSNKKTKTRSRDDNEQMNERATQRPSTEKEGQHGREPKHGKKRREAPGVESKGVQGDGAFTRERDSEMAKRRARTPSVEREMKANC
eukprot:2211732-Pleurochrysis_carterae.AAC.1